MTTVTYQSSLQTETVSIDWQSVLWREWRNCNDEEYSEQLFELIKDEPVTGWAIILLVLLLVLQGIIGGVLVALLLNPPVTNMVTPFGLMILGAIFGGIVGWIATIILKRTGLLYWQKWLQTLLPHNAFFHKSKLVSEILSTSSLLLAVILASSVSLNVIGIALFGRINNLNTYSFFIGILIILLGGWLAIKLQTSIFKIIFVVIIGLFLPTFFGLGIAQIIGQSTAPLNLIDSMRTVGLAIGLPLGFLWGRWTGPIASNFLVISLIAVIFPFGSNVMLISWILGLLCGSIVGYLSNLYSVGIHPLGINKAYFFRKIFIWWIKRPPATKVSVAIDTHPDQTSILKELITKQNPSVPTVQLIDEMRHRNWQDRFIARNVLVNRGGVVINDLKVVARDPTFQPNKIARWLIQSICYDTTTKFAHKAEQMICPVHLTHCKEHKIRERGLAGKFYGCRICQQSHDLHFYPKGIMAILDSNLLEETIHEEHFLGVNWLIHRALFDFSNVKIVQATDEDVERFAVQVGNDTDPIRVLRYQEMECVVSSSCNLSENTIRILRQIFGQVQIRNGTSLTI